MTWIRSYTNGIEFVESLDGTDWFTASPPQRRHRCTAQTRGWMSGNYVERCACGAIRLDHWGPWLDRNQRVTSTRWWQRLCQLTNPGT